MEYTQEQFKKVYAEIDENLKQKLGDLVRCEEQANEANKHTP